MERMMFKALCGIAAGCALLAFASVAPAEAKSRQGAAIGAQTEQADEVSSQRRYHRHRHGWRGHRHWHGPRYGYYGRPYYGGGYYPYAYRPYYGYGGPTISFGFGPRWY
jgi:hypothetical protein